MSDAGDAGSVAGGKTGRWQKGRSGNPKGRQPRKDVWANPLTGLGTSRDKRTAGALCLQVVSDREARDMWRGNPIARSIVESAPADAIRGGWCLKMEDKARAELIEAALEEIACPDFVGKGANAMMRMARQYRRAYGGAAIFPVMNDASGSLALPLNDKGIGAVERLMLFEPRELQPLHWYKEGPKAGQVEIWQLNPINVGQGGSIGYVQIHESRLIIVQGKRVTAEDTGGIRQGWGDNVFTNVLSAINDYELGLGAAATLLQDFAQAVYKMKGLATATGVGGRSVAERIELMNLMRSTLKGMLIDSDDSFERIVTPTAGLPDIVDRLMYNVAAAAEMPVTKLFGMAPGGLNATGESDAKNWDRVVGIEQEDMTPQLEQLVRFFMLSKDSPSKGKEPAAWSIEWYPLSQPTAKEKADTELVVAQRDQIYYEMGVVSEAEIAESHWSGDTYSPDLVVNWETREAHETEMAKAAATAEAAAGGAPGGAPSGESIQQQVFNGAQVASMVEVVKAAVSKEIPRESAAAILELAFQINSAQAMRLLGPESFEAKPAAPAIPFGAKPPTPPGDETPPAPDEEEPAGEEAEA